MKGTKDSDENLPLYTNFPLGPVPVRSWRGPVVTKLQKKRHAPANEEHAFFQQAFPNLQDFMLL